MSWTKRLVGVFLGSAFSPGSRGKRAGAPRSRRVLVEPLEDRRLLSVGGTCDYGDLPDNYGTTLVADGARHEAVGPMLGATRDTEADGLPTVGADGDDTSGGADEDGVTLGTIQVGQLDASVTVNVQNAPSGARLDAWIDFNGDGAFGGRWEQIADAVAVNDGDNLIEFAVPSSALSGETYARFRLSTSGDLGPVGSNVDGEVEDYQILIVAPAASDGYFEPRDFPDLSSTLLHSVDAADLDGDGDVEVLCASVVDYLSWWDNTGSGQFTPYQMGEAGGHMVALVVDVNGDGDMDILVGDPRGIAWLENDGHESFTPRAVTADQKIYDHESLSVADLDGDGDVDFLALNIHHDKLVWNENDGDGNFTARNVTTDHVGSIMPADMDGDGDMDILASYRGLKWYENDGHGNFATYQKISEDSLHRPIAVDVDRDGDMDVIANGNDMIAWLENDGNQNFVAHTVTTSVDNVKSLFAADMDGDGDMDALSASSGDTKVAWYENDGVGSFTTHTITTSAYGGVHSVLAADLDGDGDLDVVSVAAQATGPNYENNGIAWYENTTPIDFGDAPDSYGTTLAADGARHAAVGPMLGAMRDVEADGQPSVEANGDDYSGSSDEYGVTFGLVMAGQGGGSATVNVQNALGGAKLDAWIDFGGNGTFDPGDQIADSVDVVEGENMIRFDVPDMAAARQTYARFRLSNAGDLGPTGPASDGEVEDHRVMVYPATAPVDLGEIDFVELPRTDTTVETKIYTFTTKYAGYLTAIAWNHAVTGQVSLQLFDESGNAIGQTSSSLGDDTRIDHLDLVAGKTYTLQLSGTSTVVGLTLYNLVQQVDGAVTVHGTDDDDKFYYLAGDMHTVTVKGIAFELDPAAISSIHFACEGNDYASLTGSTGAEAAELRPHGGSMTTTATGFTVSVEDAWGVAVHGGGGDDTIELFDGPGDDFFDIRPHWALLRPDERGAPSTLSADDFPNIHVYAKAGGDDTAKFWGTKAERIKVYPEIVKMTKGDYYTRAKFFEHVEVDANLGADTAIVTGSDGSDVLSASRNGAVIAYDVDLPNGERSDLPPTDYGVWISACENLVARGKGQDDWVQLYDSDLNDVLIAKPHRVDMMNGPRPGVERGEDYRLTVRGYGHVSAFGGEGDTAKLYDSGEDGVDLWAAAYVDGETWSSMSSPSRLMYEVLAFEHVGGYGFNDGQGKQHGTNRRDHAADVDFVFKHGYWEGDEEPRNPRHPRGR